MVSGNIHTHPMEDHWKFQGDWAFQKVKVFKDRMKLKWNLQRGGKGGSNPLLPPPPPKKKEERVWIFCGTTQCSLTRMGNRYDFLKRENTMKGRLTALPNKTLDEIMSARKL